MPATSPSEPEPSTRDLSGAWRFVLDPADEGIHAGWFRESLAGQISLPGSIDAQGLGRAVTPESEWTGTIFDRSYFEAEAYALYREPGNIKIPFWLQPESHYLGTAWYQKSFEIENDWKGKPVSVYFERPHWHTRVWLNEREVGTGNSLSTPHQFDLGILQSGEAYRLTVCIDNRLHVEVGENAHSVSDHTQGNWNGIIGRIELQARETCTITQLEVIPEVATRSIRIRGAVKGRVEGEEVVLQVRAKDEPASSFPFSQRTGLNPDEDGGTFDTRMELGDNAGLWDAFDPVLYELQAAYAGSSRSTQFGLREVGRDGSQFTINGHRVFLRGTLDCCIFPLTGYPPMDVEAWRKVLAQIKAHGLNHVRFHSWCPPEAAFVAGDELGLYFQVECPVWPNAVAVLAFNSPEGIGDGMEVDRWVYAETERILNTYGNHPCFVLMACGNEPGGPNHPAFLSQWVRHVCDRDRRRLYTGSSGWPELADNDFHVPPAPRLHQWGEGLDSRLNALPPATNHDYRDAIAEREAPVVSHEIGQWCAYPPIHNTGKYKGHLKARNFEIYAASLAANHMADQAERFVQASGKLQALCYKEEVEASLRTPGQAGFQLLGLQDFPGQGTAPVGMLDAFWESKGYLEPADMRRYCSATVPLLRLGKRVFSDRETLEAGVEVAHFGARDLTDATVVWELACEPDGVVRRGECSSQTIHTGGLSACGQIEADLTGLRVAEKYTLTLSLAGSASTASNNWELWLYPETLSLREPANPAVVSSLAEALPLLESGHSVLLIGKPDQVAGEVALGFSPIFWNTACTQNQPPHTLGILCDPEHPAFEHFPTDFHSNWQWWYPLQASAAMVLDALPPECRPLIQVIDDWFKNRRLGLVFEARVGSGKLLACSIDLLSESSNAEAKLVCRQLQHSLTEYIHSDRFQPATKVAPQALQSVFARPL